MKTGPKVLLAVALLLAIVLVIQIRASTKSTQVKLEAEQDYFKVTFDIKKLDEDKAKNTLERLNLPQSILTGLKFELDSTSSAKLAFASPIISDVAFRQHEINFVGQLSSSDSAIHTINPKLKIPQNANIGIFAKDFEKFATKKQENQKLQKWYLENFSSQGQYLITFGNGNFTIVSPKKDKASFDRLEQLFAETEDYKQESHNFGNGNAIELHILKSEDTFFQIGNTLYFASSPQAAKDFANSQIGNAPSLPFWDSSLEEVSLAVFWQKQETSSREDLDLILGEDQNFTKYLENIEKIKIVQIGDKFEGGVKFKK